jgi:hypothetical protein
VSRGKTKQTTTSTFNNQTNLNDHSRGLFDTQFNKVSGMLDGRQAAPYGGQFVAGLSGREQQARNMFEQNMGSFNPGFDEGEGLIRGATWDPQQMGAARELGTGLMGDFGAVADRYMNPYQQNVINVMRQQSNDAMNERLAQSRERDLRNRAYGGSGSAVSQGIAMAEAQKGLDAQTAGLLYQGFNDARGFYGQDLDRSDNRIRYANDEDFRLTGYNNDIGLQRSNFDMQRGGLLADMAGRRHGLAMNDIYGLNELGEVDRGIEQDRLGMEYNDFLRQDEDQWRKIQAQMGLLGSIPMLTNTSGTQSSQSTQTTNPGLLGTLGQLGGIASMFVPGGQLGGLMSGAMKSRQKAAGAS